MREIQTYTRYYEQEVRFGQERLANRQLLQYDPDIDTWRYKALRELRFANPARFEVEKQIQDSLTAFNLRTALGERFSVLASKRTYDIREGELYDPAFPESLHATFQRGQEYRRKNGSSRDDQEREAAEVATFRAIQNVLSDPKTPTETTMLCFSPPGKRGSEYMHNFYDTFTLREGEEGRYVDYRRYSSALTREETIRKVVGLNPLYAVRERQEDPTFIPDDVYFIKNPLRLDPIYSPFTAPDVIHRFFHKNHIYMEPEELELIVQDCQGVVALYISTLATDPDDIRMRNILFNAYLNTADISAVARKAARDASVKQAPFFNYALRTVHEFFVSTTHDELLRLGAMPVREVLTGCGSSKGMSIEEVLQATDVRNMMHSPFSVMDFGKLLSVLKDESYSFDKEGSCVNCGRGGAKLGPCGICESCDKYLRTKQQLLSPVTVV